MYFWHWMSFLPPQFISNRHTFTYFPRLGSWLFIPTFMVNLFIQKVCKYLFFTSIRYLSVSLILLFRESFNLFALLWTCVPESLQTSWTIFFFMLLVFLSNHFNRDRLLSIFLLVSGVAWVHSRWNELHLSLSLTQEVTSQTRPIPTTANCQN